MSHQSSTNAMMSIEWYEERINEIRAIPMANQCSPAMQDALQLYYRQLVSELETKKRLIESAPILVPAHRPFTKNLAECANFTVSDKQNLVDVDRVVQESIAFVDKHLHTAGNISSQHIPPLMLRFPGRSGKTNSLYFIGEVLKQRGNVNVLVLTFHNDCGLKSFRHVEGESQKNAFLRIIAAQLVDCTQKERLRLQCDEAALEAYIAQSGRPFVLLVDDLCYLSSDAPDVELASLIRRMFLDPIGRYCVFSSRFHVTFADDPHALIGFETVSLPIAHNLQELRQMHPKLNTLTRATAQWYRWLPGLTYTSTFEFTPAIRFLRRYFDIDDKMLELGNFVALLLTGKPANDDPFELYAAGVVDADDPQHLMEYPLCYVHCVFDLLKCDSASYMIDDELRAIERTHLNTDHIDWKAIVRIAVLLQCLNAKLNGGKGPFGLALDTSTNIQCRSYESQWSEDVHTQIHRNLGRDASNTCVVYHGFSDEFKESADLILVFKDKDSHVSTKLIQTKTRGYPMRSDVIQWADLNSEHVLVRDYPTDATKAAKLGYTSLDHQQTLELLGRSLMYLLPSWDV